MTVLIFLLLNQIVIALGISPAKKVVYFVPNKNETITFNLINNEHKDLKVVIEIHGDLTNYIELSDKLLDLNKNEDYKGAIDSFEKAISLEPKLYEALYNLACCFAMTNSKEKAIMNLNKACNLSPECAAWAKDDMEFESMRDDPEFLNVVENTELKSIVAK